MNPCEDSAFNPCTGEPGQQCWYEACGDDDSTLCNISCRRDDMASITGIIEVPIDSTDGSSNGNGLPTDIAGGITTVPGRGPITVPSIEELMGGNTTGSSTCPDGSAPVNCLFDPCAATTCLVGTKCVSNYCGGESQQCPLPTGAPAVYVCVPLERTVLRSSCCKARLAAQPTASNANLLSVAPRCTAPFALFLTGLYKCCAASCRMQRAVCAAVPRWQQPRQLLEGPLRDSKIWKWAAVRV
jgi:hypothetical protein